MGLLGFGSSPATRKPTSPTNTKKSKKQHHYPASTREPASNTQPHTTGQSISTSSPPSPGEFEAAIPPAPDVPIASKPGLSLQEMRDKKTSSKSENERKKLKSQREEAERIDLANRQREKFESEAKAASMEYVARKEWAAGGWEPEGGESEGSEASEDTIRENHYHRNRER